MDEISKSILSNIKSGNYFADARAWYARKYVYPVIERSIISVIAVVFGIGMIYTGLQIYELYPIKKDVSIVLKLPDTLNYVPKFKSIENKDQPVDVIVSNHLVSEYILNRESYSYHNFINQINKIRNTSTKFVFKQYYNYINLENPDSPRLVYNKYATRTIEILSISPTEEENNVIVKFIATVNDNRTKEVIKTKWLANIHFYLANIYNNMENSNDTSKNGKSRLDFAITDYQVQEIK